MIEIPLCRTGARTTSSTRLQLVLRSRYHSFSERVCFWVSLNIRHISSPARSCNIQHPPNPTLYPTDPIIQHRFHPLLVPFRLSFVFFPLNFASPQAAHPVLSPHPTIKPHPTNPPARLARPRFLTPRSSSRPPSLHGLPSCNFHHARNILDRPA